MEFWNAPKLSVAAVWNSGTDYVSCHVNQWPYPAARTLFELNRGSTSLDFNGTAGGNIFTFKGSGYGLCLSSICLFVLTCSPLGAEGWIDHTPDRYTALGHDLVKITGFGLEKGGSYECRFFLLQTRPN